MRQNLLKASGIFLVLAGLLYLVLGTSALTDETLGTGQRVMLAGISVLGGFVLLIGPMVVRRFPRGGPPAVAAASLLVALFWPPMLKLLVPLAVLVTAAAIYQGMQTRRNLTAAA